MALASEPVCGSVSEGERAEQVSPRQRLEVALFLRRRGVAGEYSGGEIVYLDDGGGRPVARGYLLQRQRERRMVHAGAAPFLRDRYAVQAHRGQAFERLLRERAVTVPGGGVGGDLLARILAHRVAQHLLFFGQDHGTPIG